MINKKLPEVTFKIRVRDDSISGDNPFKWISKTTSDFFSNKKVILFSLPGAFTPTCARNHLPGFIENADKIREKAVDEIVCFATNDIFTMSAWEEMSGSNGKIKFLSDSKAEFAKSLGTDYPDTFGTSIKTKRCSLLVNDGIIEKFFVEVDGGKVDVSGANKMMELL